MDSDNSSVDGDEVRATRWRESNDAKSTDRDEYSGLKGPKSPPLDANDDGPHSPGSTNSSRPASPRSPYEQTPHTPPEREEQNGDADGPHSPTNGGDDDRLSLSPEQGRGDSRSRSLAVSRPPPASLQSPSSPRSPVAAAPESKVPLKSLAEDLSDVSDIESLDGNDNDILNAAEEEVEETKGDRGGDERKKAEKNKVNGDIGVKMSLEVGEDEQLDFDEEPPEDGEEEDEDGECEKLKEDASVAAATTTNRNNLLGGKKPEPREPIKLDEELEEGEVSDEGEVRPEESEPRPICRFYSRGACTWGSSCRFLHPGVTDKGNYTMFEMVRPMVPPGYPAPHMGLREHYALEPRALPSGVVGPPSGVTVGSSATTPVVGRKEESGGGVVPVAESAWERGLRQAKEILQKSTKRKETEVDFEEKKMNLTLGQDELDKENDYYTRSASPALSPSPDRLPRKEYDVKPHYIAPPEERLPPVPHHGGPPPAVHHIVHDPYYRPPLHDPYWPHHPHARALPPPHHPPPHHHHLPPHYEDPHRIYARPPRYGPPPAHDYYEHPPSEVYAEGKSRHKPAREVIVQRVEKPSRDWKDGSPGSTFDRARRESPPPSRRPRADEWADPWMRSKSPGGGGGGNRAISGRKRRRTRRSSGSSYSSSSSRSSSSRSSYSSYSDSRSSRSRSRSAVPTSKRKPPMQFKLSPSSRPKPPARGKPASPPPVRLSNKLPKLPFAASPPEKRSTTTGGGGSSSNAPGGGVPPRLLAQAKATVKEALRFSRFRSRSSSASSSASSSSSSSSSEESSSDSSSSSKRKTPSPPPSKKKGSSRLSAAAAASASSSSGVTHETTKKGGDAVKSTSGGASAAGQKQQTKSSSADAKSSTAKKRPVPPVNVSADVSPNKTPPGKKSVPSRREELLKQLKAVEDAIARKRSKI